MISLNYSCTCGTPLATLDDAQQHVDVTRHVVTASGTVSSRRPPPLTRREIDQQELKRLERDIDRLKAQLRRE